jgi:RHH-type proline utilization regulon transcriptional repressor/proline dehydrogenase/delta 1-pyrroline-5-carboxylate dehydrogenase
MTTMSPRPLAGKRDSRVEEFESSVRKFGDRLFDAMDKSESPSLFSRKGLYRSAMEWAMRDEQFKTQLFRFVDVLPMLGSTREIADHLQDYLGEDGVKISPVLRAGLRAAGGASWLFGAGIKSQVTGLARQFMLGNDENEISATLRKLHEQGIAFTVDILGETVVSETEANRYAERYLELMTLLEHELSSWDQPCQSNESSRGPLPALNVSVKISALYSQIQPADPETALMKLSERLRPILRRAKTVGAFINFDMESYALKELTLQLFKTIFAEPEFAEAPACGLALQAYLSDCETDLTSLLNWVREQQRRITVRLVKGAYWDYETVLSRQRHWPSPVFGQKWETDANFEKLSRFLLENGDVLEAAFGTHNARSIASILAHAERLGIERRSFEFQMLYGMAEPLKAAVLGLGCRLREYCPVGELLPGMAYLVRRLLENTSNEGFLANKFGKGASREELLKAPGPAENSKSFLAAGFEFERGCANAKQQLSERIEQAGKKAQGFRQFQNEPHTDFTIPSAREKARSALTAVRGGLGRRYPLIINHQPVSTGNWLASVNPADQREVIGYAGQGSIADAESALSAARAAQRDWGPQPAEHRASLLEQLAQLIRRDKANLCALEILEAGKNWTEADADVAEAIDFCNFYAACMREMALPVPTQAVSGESNVQHWWPRGVGVIIAPWNFPLAILTGMTTAAVVSGNAVIMKPSEQTPVIASRLMELFMEAGFPAGTVNLLTGPGSSIGSHLVAHPAVDFIAFTGSKEVGLKIWETASQIRPGQANLKKIVCEMGGKNAMIVDNDADLDEAVLGCISSAFSYQGQKCSALSRLIVLAENYEKFIERLIAAAESLSVGPAEKPGTIIGPVINRDAQQRITAIIEAGRAEATLAWLGEVPDDPNACYVTPAIFTDVPPGSRLFREEIFGPILSVTKAADFDEAMRLANDSEFALTAGLYSRSPQIIQRAKAELVCGNLNINRTITGAIVERQPFGGFKMSGGGTKAGGREYLQNFLVPRVVTENCIRRGFAPEE